MSATSYTTNPRGLPRHAACSAAAIALSTLTLGAALMPSITVAAVAPARTVFTLPRVLIQGSVAHAPVAIVDLPPVRVVAMRAV